MFYDNAKMLLHSNMSPSKDVLNKITRSFMRIRKYFTIGILFIFLGFKLV
jgi:hypothetical protein